MASLPMFDAEDPFDLGVTLAEHGRLSEAEDAFRHADDLGNCDAASNLGRAP